MFFKILNCYAIEKLKEAIDSFGDVCKEASEVYTAPLSIKELHEFLTVEGKIWNQKYTYYKQFDRLYCVVVKHAGTEGFLITAYPTDKVKEGDVIWTK